MQGQAALNSKVYGAKLKAQVVRRYLLTHFILLAEYIRVKTGHDSISIRVTKSVNEEPLSHLFQAARVW